MTHMPHATTDEFQLPPEDMHRLETASQHFAALNEAYRNLTIRIGRIESRVEPATPSELEALRSTRRRLTAEISATIFASGAHLA